MASLDGRVIVAFDETVPQEKVSAKLQHIVRAQADRFIDTTNLDHTAAVLGFLPYSFTQRVRSLEGFQQWTIDALMRKVLSDPLVAPVFPRRILFRLLEKQLGYSKCRRPRWSHEHALARRTYVIRHLLSGDILPQYGGTEEELCAQLRRREEVAFAAVVPTLPQPYPDAKDSLLNIHAAHYLLVDLQGRGQAWLRAKFPQGLPESPQEIEQFAELKRTTEPILEGVCRMELDGAESEAKTNHLTIPGIFRNMLEYNVAVYHLLNEIVRKDERSERKKKTG